MHAGSHHGEKCASCVNELLLSLFDMVQHGFTTTVNTGDVVANYHVVCGRIAAAEAEAKRPPASVGLFVGTKTFPAAGVRPLLAAGHRRFGENRVQEAAAKWP